MADDLYDTDIPWGLPPAPVDVPLSFEPSTSDELGWVYAEWMATEAHLQSVQADLAITRELVQRALDHCSALTVRLKQQAAQIKDQSRQIRELMGVRADMS